MKTSKEEKELLRDSHIKKIRTDPFFLGEGDSTSEEVFSSYLAEVLNVTQEDLLDRYSKKQLKKVIYSAVYTNGSLRIASFAL